MASPLKPVYLANSLKELLKMVDSGMRLTNNADTLVGYYMSASKAMADGDQELAFILFKRALNKYYSQETFDNSIISEKEVTECREHINNLTKSLQERYEEKRMRDTGVRNVVGNDVRNDNKGFNSRRDNVVPKNSINFRNTSPNINEFIVRNIFSKYGKIKRSWFNVSNGQGHGFVEFENSDSAKLAIQLENGCNYNGFPITVQKFLPKKEKTDTGRNTPIRNNRSGRKGTNSFNSFRELIIKNIKNEISTERELQLLFHRFGKINYVRIHRRRNGEATGFADIQFESSESAVNAMREMNDFQLPSGKKIGVDIYNHGKRNKNKGKSGFSSGFTSRSASRINSDDEESSDEVFSDASSSMSATSSLMRKMTITDDNVSKSDVGNNLYIKGFKNEIKNDQELENLFKQFGSIKSAKCIIEKNEFGDFKKHFGYICFENAADAKVALLTMNGFTFPSGVTIKVMPYMTKEMRINKQSRSRPTTPMFGTSDKNRSCDFQRSSYVREDSGESHASGSQAGNQMVGIPDENKVYVKNFGTLVTSKEDLQSLFAHFGNILATRLTLHKSIDKSFGIISFDNAINANKAISEMNGCEIEPGRNLIVNHYTRSAPQRKTVDKQSQSPKDNLKLSNVLKIEPIQKVVKPSTKIFIKNINEFYTTQELLHTFGDFGRIKFATVLKDERGSLRGLAYIDFYKTSCALNAIETMNGSELMNGEVMKVERFMESFEVREYLKINFLSQFKVNGDIRQAKQCFICALNVDTDLIVLYCQHKFCKSCLQKYVSYLMDHFEVETILCPSVVCQNQVGVSILRQLGTLFPYLHERQRFVRENRLIENAEMWCPRDWCRANIAQSNISDSHVKCRKCGYEFCFRCGDDFHNDSECDA